MKIDCVDVIVSPHRIGFRLVRLNVRGTTTYKLRNSKSDVCVEYLVHYAYAQRPLIHKKIHQKRKPIRIYGQRKHNIAHAKQGSARRCGWRVRVCQYYVYLTFEPK